MGCGKKNNFCSNKLFYTQPFNGISYDPDAAAFFTAAGITDATEKSAINAWVLELKAGSLWTKCYQILPLVFNDATKNTFDLKGTYNATMNGSITHSGRYVTGDGASGYISTGVNANTVLTIDNCGTTFNCNTNSTEDAYTGGCFDGLNYFMYQNRNSANLGRNILNDAAAGGFNFGLSGGAAITDARGVWTFNRVSNASKTQYYSGGALDTPLTQGQSSKPNLEIYFLKANYVGASYSSRAYNCYVLHQGLSAGDSAALQTSITNFKTALGI